MVRKRTPFLYAYALVLVLMPRYPDGLVSFNYLQLNIGFPASFLMVKRFSTGLELGDLHAIIFLIDCMIAYLFFSIAEEAAYRIQEHLSEHQPKRAIYMSCLTAPLVVIVLVYAKEIYQSIRMFVDPAGFQ